MNAEQNQSPTILQALLQLLNQHSGEIVPVQIRFADQSTKTLQLFEAEGHIGLLPRGKKKFARQFNPPHPIQSFTRINSKKEKDLKITQRVIERN